MARSYAQRRSEPAQRPSGQGVATRWGADSPIDGNRTAAGATRTKVLAAYLAGDRCMTQLTQLQTDRSQLSHTRIVTATLPELKRGDLLLKIDRLAVTTNNVTYAAFGDTPGLRYWDFFPTGEADWGHMPAWGFGHAVASEVEGIAVGERFFGYWPIASHLRVQPTRVSERRFFDGAPHRQGLTDIYNQYLRTSADPAYRVEDENYVMLLRPLFTTSCMLADFLQDNRFFGTRQLLVSSASSKTAFGTAFCLQSCLPHEPDLKIVALTSNGNRAFVDSLGCYTSSIAYGALEQLDPEVPTVYVDFSGDEELRARVHHHFKDALAYDCYAGSAQAHDFLRDIPLPGPAAKQYFAPVQIAKRNKDWGAAEVASKLNAWERAFIERVSRPGQAWMQVQEHHGFAASKALVEAVCRGEIDPRQGHVLVLD